MLNTIQVGQLHRVSSTRVFNADKEGVTQTLSFTVNAPTETADKVLELAEQGAPVYVQVGTLQQRMPLKAEPESGTASATDPSNKPASPRRAKATTEEEEPD